MKILTQILDLICNFLRFKIKKEEKRINEEEKEKKSKKTLDEQKQEANDAVFNGDTEMINKILTKCILIAFCLAMTGCRTEKIIYVSSDREVKKLTYENVDGYFVPNLVMSELLEYKVEAKYYKEAYEKLKYKEDNQ